MEEEKPSDWEGLKGVWVHLFLLDSTCTRCSKAFLTSSRQLSIFFNLAFIEGGILMVICSVQASGLSVLKLYFVISGLPLGFGIACDEIKF